MITCIIIFMNVHKLKFIKYFTYLGVRGGEMIFVRLQKNLLIYK